MLSRTLNLLLRIVPGGVAAQIKGVKADIKDLKKTTKQAQQQADEEAAPKEKGGEQPKKGAH